MKKIVQFILTGVLLLGLFGCNLESQSTIDENRLSEEVTLIENLQHIEHFRKGALEHILEGELNQKGQAVGFHYDQLPTKKGEIVEGSKTEPDEFGVFEAKVIVSDVEKKSNGGKSTFFPDEWDTQDVVDAINEAYDERVFISGNTYEGLTTEGVIIRMYLDSNEKIISAFPIYEGG
ncbi:EndoU domain-containing protein [Pseudogracilibacillus sp. SE30717A]|uniref:EndoU domain-containing protein n=1 Tax=Pseudogracilibacillus sp. SE30717A TaxID=3098293 RepID=UPI00300E69B5